MAKMKTFAVDIEYTVKETIFVDARRPNGAAQKALTQEAYSEAHRYDDDDCHMFLPKGAKVVRVREVGA